ncbi:MAG: hypothetical protein V2A66_01465 [Pseudomonadota bacterium]
MIDPELKIYILAPLFYLLLFAAVGSILATSPDIAFVMTGIILFLIFFLHTKEGVFFYSVYLAFEETILQHIPGASFLFIKYSGDLMITMLALAVFTKLATRRYTLQIVMWNPINKPLLIFVGLAILSALINEVPFFPAFAGMRQLLRFVVLFYLITIISTSEWDSRTVRSLLAVLACVVVIQALIGYAQAILGPGSSFNHFLSPGRSYFYEGIWISGGLSWADSKGVYGTMLSKNTYGVFMMSVSVFILGMLQMAKQNRERYMLILVIAAPCILLSYARQSMYGFLIGGAAISIVVRNKRLLIAIIMMASLLVLLARHQAFEDPKISEEATISQRFVSTFHKPYIKRSMAGDRLFVATKITPKLFASKYIFLGLGPAAFGSAVGSAIGYLEGYKKMGVPTISAIVSDVGFVSLLGQFGIIGLGAMMMIFVRLFVSIYHLHKNSDDEFFRGMALGSMGLLCAFIITNFGYVNFELRQCSFCFWLLLALTLTYWGKDTVAKLGLAEGDEKR